MKKIVNIAKKLVLIAATLLSAITIFASSGQLEEKCLTWVEKYYSECDEKYNEDYLSKSELLNHVQNVNDIAQEILKDIGENTTEKKRRVTVAAYFHDIEKMRYGDEHDKKGAKYITDNEDELKEKLGLTNKDIDKITEMIRFHSKCKYIEGTEKIDSDNEARSKVVKVIQDADKISKLYKEKGKEAKKKYDKKWSSYSSKKQKEIMMYVTKKGLNFKESEKIFGNIFDEV